VTYAVTVRIDPDVKAKLDRCGERMPIASQSRLAAAALELGLDALEKRPALLLRGTKGEAK
jgi:predicted transcriptional regulator